MRWREHGISSGKSGDQPGFGKYAFGIKAGCKAYISELTGPIPIGPIKVSVGGAYGVGATFQLGYIPGSNKFYSASFAYGLGLSIGVGPNDDYNLKQFLVNLENSTIFHVMTEPRLIIFP